MRKEKECRLRQPGNNLAVDLLRKIMVIALIAACLCSSLVPVTSIQARAVGDKERFSASGAKTHFDITFPNGSELISWTSIIRKQSDGKAVFCLEPTHKINDSGEYEAKSPEGRTMDAYSAVLGASVSTNKLLTADKVREAAKYVYHGWESKRHPDQNDYIAVQMLIWELIWGIGIKNLDNFSLIREKIALIRQAAKAHMLIPFLEGKAYDPKTNTLTLKYGETCTLNDRHNISGEVLVNNPAGIQIDHVGNQWTFSAAGEARDGKIIWAKFPLASQKIVSLVYEDPQGGQKVGEFKLSDPVRFGLEIKVVKEGKLCFKKIDEKGEPLSGGRFNLINSKGETVGLKLIRPSLFHFSQEGGETAFAASREGVEITGLPPGRYTIKELSAPEGFMQQPKTDLVFDLDFGKVKNLTMTNNRQKARVRLKKLAAYSNKPLAGVLFSLEQDGKMICEFKSDGLGTACSSSVLPGVYELFELKTAPGYVLKGKTLIKRLSIKGDTSGKERLIDLGTVTNEPQKFKVELKKSDKESLQALKGARFSLRDPSGRELEQLLTDEKGVASSKQHPLLYPAQDYSIVEIKAPDGYKLDKQNVFLFRPEGNSSDELIRVHLEAGNMPLKKRLIMRKAVWQLEGDHLKFSPSGCTFLLTKKQEKAGQFLWQNIAEITADSEGRLEIPELTAGVYRLHEIKAAQGLLQLKKAIEFSLILNQDKNALQFKLQSQDESGTLFSTLINEAKQNGREVSAQRMPAKAEGEDLLLLNRAQYGRLAVHKLVNVHKQMSKSVEHNEAAVSFVLFNEEGKAVDEFITNSEGLGYSKWLPVGKYILHQKSATEEAYSVPDRTVELSGDGVLQNLIIRNEPVCSRVKLIKIDAEDKQAITTGGISFRLYKEDGEALSVGGLSCFYTDSNGVIELPEPLPQGGYYFVEQSSAEGYVLAQGRKIKFRIDKKNALEPAPSQTPLLTLYAENQKAKGLIRVRKNGECIKGWKDQRIDRNDLSGVKKGQLLYTPLFSKAALKGAEFEIRAAERIDKHDGQQLYAKGELVQTIVSDTNGIAVSGLLPLGRYWVCERLAPNHYALSRQKQLVTLKQSSAVQEVVESELVFENFLQKASWSLDKKFEEVNFRRISVEDRQKVIFGLFLQEDYGKDESFLAKGSLVGLRGIDAQGELVFDNLLPGVAYECRELKTVQGYQLTDTSWKIQYKPDRSSPIYVNLYASKPAENQLRKHRVKLRKTSAGDKKAVLEDAVYQLFYLDGTKAHSLGEYRTDNKGELIIENLPEGRFRLQEIKAPEGYHLPDQGMEFSLDNCGSELLLNVVNEPTRIRIKKIDQDSSETVSGAVLELLDDLGHIVHRWQSKAMAEVFEAKLTAGRTYTLREVEPAPGYEMAESIEFTVPKNKTELLEISFANKKTTTLIRKVDSAGDALSGAKLSLYDSQNRLIASWISETKEHLIRGLHRGELYRLHEDLAPSGYKLSSDQYFRLSDKQQETVITMVDDILPEIPVSRTGEEGKAATSLTFISLSFLGLGLVRLLIIWNRRNARSKECITEIGRSKNIVYKWR